MDSAIQQVATALRQRGFSFVNSAYGYAFEGHIDINGTPVRARVELPDDSFADLPLVRLLESPANFPRILPHISADGYVCYAVRGTISLDIFDPVGQTLACLERATSVIARAATGQMDSDLADEFFAYWTGGLALADVPLTDKRPIEALLSMNPCNRDVLIVLTDDKCRSQAKLAGMNFQAEDVPLAVHLFRTNATPGVRRTGWPLRTVGEFLSWQGELDADCARKIKAVLLVKMAKERRRLAVLLVQSPTSWYGLLVQFARTPNERSLFQRLNILPALLHSSITPLTVVRIDDGYIASRNQPSRATLVGKRIAMFGCGTIGGYLADLLMRAGAGLGGGELAVIDGDLLSPGNLGRHRLGFPSLFRNKASQLANELSRAIPSAKVTPYSVDVRAVAGLDKFDLVIDATGEEALSNYLNAKLSGKQFVPLVFAWIQGAGYSVHTLVRDTKEVGCYQCLHRTRLAGVDARHDFPLAGRGCESLYVPFPASTSIFAAALALDAVLDWANGAPSPRYRSRMTNTGSSERNHDVEIGRVSGCPVCDS